MVCARSICESLLRISCVVCAIAGILLMVLGAINNSNLSYFQTTLEDLPNVISLTSILMIVSGFIIFGTAYFGCVGVMRRNSCFLMTYAIMLTIIWVFQISWISYVFTQLGDDSDLEKNLYQSLRRVFQNNNGYGDDTVNYIQTTMKCCGMNGPLHGERLPSSCCSTYVNNVCVPFKHGCWAEFYDFISGSTHAMVTVVGSLAAIKLLGAGVVICILNTNKKYLSSV